MTPKLPPGAPRKPPGRKTGRKGATGALSSARAIATAKREAEAVALRLAGANLTEIAKQVGYADPSGAYRAIQKALSIMLPAETRDEALKRELATLDRLQLAMWQPALRGDEKAAGVVLRCIGQRSKLLGLEPIPSLNAVSNDVVQGVLDALIGLAVRMLTEEQRPAFLAQVETTLLQIEAPREGS